MNNRVPVKDQAPDVKRQMIVAVVKSVLAGLVMAVALFWVAGRWNWLMGWVYAGLMALTAVSGILASGPELLAERSGVQKGAKQWDVPLAILVARVGPLVTLLVAGLDERLGWSGVADWPQWAAVLLALLGTAITAWAMATNRFFSAVVRIQEDRDHRVITGGPYHYVRHPGYAGAILFTLVTPLILDSLWALVPAVLTVAVLVVRTAKEDRTLQEELGGYTEYTRTVRYRLLPGVW